MARGGGGGGGAWDDLIVVWGNSPWFGLGLGDQDLAQALSAHHPVLHVDPLRSRAKVGRGPDDVGPPRSRRIRMVGERLAVVSPVSPPARSRAGVHQLATAWSRHVVRWAVDALGASVQAVLSGPSGHDTYDLPGDPVRVFRVSDDYHAGARLVGLPAKRIRRDELRLARQADVVVCVSPVLVEQWRGLGFDAVLIPNGCDVGRLRSARLLTRPADIEVPDPVVGFLGQLSSRIDFGLLHAVAEPGHSLLLIGPRRSDLDPRVLEELVAYPNVQWLGARGRDQLPAYTGALAVGLVPYRDDPFNHASFPLKTLEYLAAGAPVVATDLPAARWVGSRHVHIAAGPDDFATAVAAALDDAGRPAATAERVAIAEQHGWDRRAEDYLDLIARLEAARRGAS